MFCLFTLIRNALVKCIQYVHIFPQRISARFIINTFKSFSQLFFFFFFFLLLLALASLKRTARPVNSATLLWHMVEQGERWCEEERDMHQPSSTHVFKRCRCLCVFVCVTELEPNHPLIRQLLISAQVPAWYWQRLTPCRQPE